MIKVYPIALSILTISIFSITACKKNNEKCLGYSNARVEKVNGPDTALPYQEINLVVLFSMNNGCGKFDHLELINKGDSVFIDIIAKYEGCACTDILLSGQTPFKFSASKPGVYYLKFVQPDNSYFVDTIIVN